MEKDKLEIALKVSGLRTVLWEVNSLIGITLVSSFPEELKSKLKGLLEEVCCMCSACDGYLDDYVENVTQTKE